MKIGIIGAGNVGGTLAMRVLEKGLGEVVMLDVAKGIAEGKALDMNEAGPAMGYEPGIVGTDDYGALKGAEIIVITAGLPRMPGMTREELLARNLDIIKKITQKIVSSAPEAIIITVTNPLDLMTYAAYKITGFPRQRIIGMGGILDGSRLAYFISEKLKTKVEDIVPMVIGAHSDSMVVLPEYTTVSGTAITKILKPAEIKQLIERTKNGGAEVVALLKSGSSFYASSAAIFKIITAIINDTGETMPCSFYLEGEYGIKGISIGVPVKVGKGGVREVVKFELTAEEREALDKSALALQKAVSNIDAQIK